MKSTTYCATYLMFLLAPLSYATAESSTHKILSDVENSVTEASERQNEALENAKRDIDEAVKENNSFEDSQDDLARTRRELEDVDAIDGDEGSLTE